MSRVIEGKVGQVIEYDDLNRYTTPPEIKEGMEPGQVLLNVYQDPNGEVWQQVVEPPVIGTLIGFLIDLILLPVTIIRDGESPLWQDPVSVAAEPGVYSVGDTVRLEVEPAVIDRTEIRGEVTDEMIHLYQPRRQI